MDMHPQFKVGTNALIVDISEVSLVEIFFKVCFSRVKLMKDTKNHSLKLI